jgi:hypothetical protein
MFLVLFLLLFLLFDSRLTLAALAPGVRSIRDGHPSRLFVNLTVEQGAC